MEDKTFILGIDLSGPRNVADTCVVAFEPNGEHLRYVQAIQGADDEAIYNLVSSLGKQSRVVAGIDAPLSYNPGGGDRASDTSLRRAVKEKGRVGIMPPTLIRMVYLTLRGIALTRTLEALKPQIDIALVEVHPGACMLLRGAPAAAVADFKREASARLRLLEWMEIMGLSSLPWADETSDHFVAACSAALAAWKWSTGNAAWCHPAQLPEHPYDFAC